jgi:hypothetical protein
MPLFYRRKKMEKENSTAGLNADLQEVVDTLANGGYEVCGIEPEGFVNSRLERPAYRVVVTKAVPKEKA